MNNITKKYAFLILAHTDPKHLQRLVEALDYPTFDIYICLDKRVDIKAFSFDNYKTKYSKVYIINKRVEVYWGDISVVEATIEMYKQAFSTYKYYKYITLSGLCYPALSNKKIEDALNNETQSIIGYPIRGAELNKVQYHYYFNNPNRIKGYFGLILKKLGIKLGKSFLKLSDGRSLKVYFAPQWHALTGDFVEYLLNTLVEHPEIFKYFKYSYAPDELLIPTVFFNSSFSENAIFSDVKEGTHYNQLVATHYLNYQPIIQIFDETNYQDIINSGKMFFRKAVTGKSDVLLKKIDEFRNTVQY